MPAPPQPSRTPLIAALAALAAIAAPQPSTAGPLAQAAQEAEALAAAGDTVGAHTAIRDAFGAFAATLPFSIGKAIFVDAPPQGYGMYAARTAQAFAQGEPLISYVEPVGLTWRQAGDGQVESHFTVDLELMDPAGEVLAEQKAFGSFTFKGTVRNQEVFAKLTLTLDGPPAGDYVLRYRFRDAVSGAVALSDQPFTIAP